MTFCYFNYFIALAIGACGIVHIHATHTHTHTLQLPIFMRFYSFMVFPANTLYIDGIVCARSQLFMQQC